MWRRSEPPPLPITPPHVTSDEELAQARAARVQSTRHFFEAVDENLPVRKLADELRDKRQANNWGPMLEKAMKLK
jgi:hypothetical protein